MLRRKISKQLCKWVENKNKKCLVVQGARQTGKTFAIERFAEGRYEEFIEINFKQTPSAADIFSGDLTVESMVMALRFRFPEKKITPDKTLIFLDEIQECEEAITSLKFWAIDNQYDVIASGSLLGIDYKRASSYPVGYVDYMKMYGLDFEEFLWALDLSEEMIDSLASYIKTLKVIPAPIHNQMMRYFRLYVAIEVKSGNTKANSLRSIIKRNKEIGTAYKFIDGNIGVSEEGIITLPLYMASFLFSTHNMRTKICNLSK